MRQTRQHTGVRCECLLLHVVVGLRDALGTERVGSNDIRTNLQILPMDAGNDVRVCQVQLVRVADLPHLLTNHGTHSTIENQYALLS